MNDELYANLDSQTKKKAAILIENGMEVTGLILTRKATRDKCSIDLGRVRWASIDRLDLIDASV